MAQALTLKATEAGPSSFVNSQDFISFDAFDDGNDESGEENEEGQVDVPERVISKDKAQNGSYNDGKSSSKSSGKKRKTDDRIESEGKSKREKKREVARGTPWCEEIDFDRCITSADVLHEELMAFADWISPTAREHETRKMVIHLIGRAIVKQWPDADVRAFGSQNTQLYMPQGDIDLVVISPKMEAQRREGVLRSMAACLRKNNLATDVQVIAKAKVPIIKFVCTYGKYKVDISVNQTNGIDASHFVANWLRRCPALRPIIMATKLLLSQRGMSEVFSGGLGSYSVICLVISFIQMHPKIQRGEINPSLNLGVLFLEFLELYGKNFGYDEVGISIVGRGQYYRKAARGWKDDRRPFMLSIEDPGDSSNDISKGSFSILNVRQTFGGAFDIMTTVMCQRLSQKEEKKRKKKANRHRDEDEEAREAIISSARMGESDKDPDSLLGNIIGANREMIKARRDIEALWASGTLQYQLGRSPPPREPLPYEPPRRERKEDKQLPQPPRAPKAMLAKERPPRRPEVNGSSKGTSNGKQPVNTSNGSASDPVIVVDHSSDSPSKKKAKKDSHDFVPLLEEYDDSPVNQRGHDEVDSDLDSKYSNHKQDNTTRQKRGSRLDSFAKVAPKTFVVDDSASEEESGQESPEEGEAVESAPRKRRKTDEKNDERRKRKREYWENKGNAPSFDEDYSDSN